MTGPAANARSMHAPDAEAGGGPTPEIPSSLPQVIYDRLKGDILSGVLEVGQVLRQEEIARQFNVSRVPLREAFSRLEADGLLEARPRRGFAVATLDPGEILEVFELRSVIEEHAGLVAAQARNERDVREAEELVERMEALDRSAPDFHADWMLLNYAFHTRIVASSGRRRLARVADNLRSSVEPYVRVELLMTGDVEEAAREHRELLEAFRARDGATLARLSRQHVDHTARRLLAGLRSRAVAASLKERECRAA